ncbi:MAG: hypothetical protein H8E44_00790 [Planctomycetes bacterium]|nr:hypothetical protein [Planctomycetota bacterium]
MKKVEKMRGGGSGLAESGTDWRRASRRPPNEPTWNSRHPSARGTIVRTAARYALAAAPLLTSELQHPDGGSKAIWFHSLGYRRQDWERLADDLLEIARTCDEYETEYSAYGVKYKVSGVVGCPGHRPGRVLTVWIVEPDELPRLVTAYPDDDE